MKRIINNIHKIAGKFSPYQVFADWVELSALAISNSMRLIHDSIWQQREDLYRNVWNQYSEQEQILLAEMFAVLVLLLEEEPSDVLGEVFMRAELGSSSGGQFFTPFHLSELCAKLSVDIESIKSNDETIHMNEPACGAGGMIIAMAKTLKDAGVNYQKRLKVVAQDLDWRCVYMTYIQLSLLGIDAKVIQGNTLTNPVPADRKHILLTPRAMGVLI